MLLLAGCDGNRRALVEVPVPQASTFERSVQNALARARADLDRATASGVADGPLAESYGQLAMTYHAHGIALAAQPAYLNAQRLAPRDARWPYLLGQLYNDTARPADAAKAFEAALAIEPFDKPALFALGTAKLQLGALDEAQRAFEKIQDDPAARAAALAGLAKVAMARKDHATAIARFEEALTLWPSAAKLRHPLATAYRASGDAARADAVLRAEAPPGPPEPFVPDVLADAVAGKAATSIALVRRAHRFAQAGRFDLAAEAFEAAAESNPQDAATLANLGLSWANLGELGKAESALRRSLALDASNGTAQHSLALVLDRAGRDQDAIAHYEAALQREPQNNDALLQLADLQLRAGHAREAVDLYARSAARRPTPRVRLSLALAQTKAQRHAEAREQLERGLAESPSNIGIRNALARLLAAAPDGRVRDGKRALAIAQALYAETQSPDVAQTLAMALAETGAFAEAAKVQDEAARFYEQTGPASGRAFREHNLARYRAGQVATAPWPDDDPVFQPRSAAASARSS